MPDREKVIKALEICEKKDCVLCPYTDWCGEYDDSYCDCTKLLAKDALALLKEQERIIKQYQKADGFLFAHGWKWEDYIDTREEEYQIRLGKDVAEVLNHPIEVGEDGLPY